jgi:hypothetical protein
VPQRPVDIEVVQRLSRSLVTAITIRLWFIATMDGRGGFLTPNLTFISQPLGAGFASLSFQKIHFVESVACLDVYR